MEPITFIILHISPYIAAFVFLAGLVYRLYRWIAAPNIAPIPIFPRASKNVLGKVGEYILNLATFKPLLEINPSLWFASWIFHAGLFLLLIGHLRLLFEFDFLWQLLGLKTKQEIEMFALVSGGMAGLMFTIPQFYLLYRRFTPLLRKLSVFEDYFALALTLSLGITGSIMRFFEHIDVPAYRQYIVSLFTFNPTPPSEISTWFLVHFTLAQILIAYLPFGKLFHSLGAFVTNYVLYTRE